MENEEYQIKDVYAHFGVASYMAQCLERSIAMVLVFVCGKGPKEVTRAELDNVLNKTFKKTMGQLIRELRSEGYPKAMESAIDLALEKRNWLIHNYFYDRAGHFLTPKGREVMINELIEVRLLFEEVDGFLEKIFDEKSRELGISQEAVQKYMKNSLAY